MGCYVLELQTCPLWAGAGQPPGSSSGPAAQQHAWLQVPGEQKQPSDLLTGHDSSLDQGSGFIQDSNLGAFPENKELCPAVASLSVSHGMEGSTATWLLAPCRSRLGPGDQEPNLAPGLAPTCPGCNRGARLPPACCPACSEHWPWPQSPAPSHCSPSTSVFSLCNHLSRQFYEVL